MKDHIIDKKTGIAYTLVGDYSLPDMALEIDEGLKNFNQKLSSLGKYSIQRHLYLKNDLSTVYIWKCLSTVLCMTI